MGQGGLVNRIFIGYRFFLKKKSVSNKNSVY
jgi:hypothetical protein